MELKKKKKSEIYRDRELNSATMSGVVGGKKTFCIQEKK
jgi:hypothetical protein